MCIRIHAHVDTLYIEVEIHARMQQHLALKSHRQGSSVPLVVSSTWGEEQREKEKERARDKEEVRRARSLRFPLDRQHTSATQASPLLLYSQMQAHTYRHADSADILSSYPKFVSLPLSLSPCTSVSLSVSLCVSMYTCISLSPRESVGEGDVRTQGASVTFSFLKCTYGAALYLLESVVGMRMEEKVRLPGGGCHSLVVHF